MPGLSEPHDYPGMPIIVEGIDGSGKSTQLDLLRSWLIQEGYDVFFTEWNSSRFARFAVRNIDPGWLRKAYAFALRPHLTLYLETSPDALEQASGQAEV